MLKFERSSEDTNNRVVADEIIFHRPYLDLIKEKPFSKELYRPLHLMQRILVPVKFTASRARSP